MKEQNEIALGRVLLLFQTLLFAFKLAQTMNKSLLLKADIVWIFSCLSIHLLSLFLVRNFFLHRKLGIRV